METRSRRLEGGAGRTDRPSQADLRLEVLAQSGFDVRQPVHGDERLLQRRPAVGRAVSRWSGARRDIVCNRGGFRRDLRHRDHFVPKTRRAFSTVQLVDLVGECDAVVRRKDGIVQTLVGIPVSGGGQSTIGCSASSVRPDAIPPSSNKQGRVNSRQMRCHWSLQASQRGACHGYRVNRVCATLLLPCLSRSRVRIASRQWRISRVGSGGKVGLRSTIAGAVVA